MAAAGSASANFDLACSQRRSASSTFTVDQMPADLKATEQGEEQQTPKRSWFSRLTFGLFD